MRPTRTLRLHRELLADLTTDELRGVGAAGGVPAPGAVAGPAGEARRTEPPTWATCRIVCVSYHSCVCTLFC